MRSLICHLLVLSVLYMSAEGAFDMTKEPHAHGDSTGHQLISDNPLPAQPDPLSDETDKQCGHLCHGHNSSIVSDSNPHLMAVSSRYNPFVLFSIATLLQAPPTPPPNA